MQTTGVGIGEPIVEELSAAYEFAPFETAESALTAVDRHGGIRLGQTIAFETGSEGANTYGTLSPSDGELYSLANALGPAEWPMRRVRHRLTGICFSRDTAETFVAEHDHACAVIDNSQLDDTWFTLAVVDPTAGPVNYLSRDLTVDEARAAAKQMGLIATFAPDAAGGMADQYESPNGSVGPAAFAATDDAVEIEQHYPTVEVPASLLTRSESED